MTTIQNSPNVLVACEFSGVVRDAFRDEGFDAVSCDLRETERNPEYHIKGDILEVLEERGEEFDLMIAHPPCTYLSNSGVRWLYEKEKRCLTGPIQRRRKLLPSTGLLRYGRRCS